jgi:hypothetical protein
MPAPWPQKTKNELTKNRAVKTVKDVRQCNSQSQSYNNNSNTSSNNDTQHVSQQSNISRLTRRKKASDVTGNTSKTTKTARSRPQVGGRSSWMNQGACVGSRGPGTGIYGRPSKSSGRSNPSSASSSTPSLGTSDRDELISLRVEYNAQKQAVKMLSSRVNKMTVEVERSRLAARAMEMQLQQAQKNARLANERTEQSRTEETLVSDELDQYKFDLEEEKNKNNILATEISRLQHERDQARSEIKLLKEQELLKEANTRASTSSLQEMHGINAGLRRQLSDEQRRLVDARREVRDIHSNLQHVHMEISTRESELKMERERNTQLHEKIDQHETTIIQLKEKICKVTDQLNKALDVRKTAVKRAEITASKARKMESEVAGTDKVVADYELKITNLQGQIAMKDRRITLMKKQHASEISKHNGTKAERDMLETELNKLNKHLERAEGALNDRALQMARNGVGIGGPVLEGREDPHTRDTTRDSLEVESNDFQSFSIQDAMRMGVGVGGNNNKSDNNPQRVEFKRINDEPQRKSNNPSIKKGKKMSRKENLMMIRKMTSQMVPDAAKLPGSDAPSWMKDDDDIM